MTETLTVPDLPENYRATVEADPDPDTSYMDQPGFTHMRAIYESGEFSFVGVVLEKVCECCEEWRTVGSLWGIEHSGTRDSVDYLVDTAMELFHEDQPDEPETVRIVCSNDSLDS